MGQLDKKVKTEQNLKITSRGRYAVMAMVRLADRAKDKPVPLLDIAQENDISLSYLEQLISALRRNGLVKSYRGPGGGYVLARNAEQIYISEILLAAEDATPAKKTRSAPQENECFNTAVLWSHISRILEDHLQRITLCDVLNGRLSTQDI